MAGGAMNEIARAIERDPERRYRVAALLKQATAALLVAALPVACSGPSTVPSRPPLEGARIGGPFALVDQDGKAVTDRTFAGKYRIMYFGYTFCPDVCPVDMQNIGAALRILDRGDPAIAAKIAPIFVSVDPDRDTPAVLKQFVRAFHPRMVGLTGSPQAIAQVAKEYAVYYQKGEVTPGGGYMVAHARVAYLMDPLGKPVALLPQDQAPDKIATEIRRWVR
jgi:protein SCO1/2